MDKKIDGSPLPDPLLTESEAASLLGVKPRFLQLDRSGPRRLPFVRLTNRLIRYRRSDLEAYVAGNTVPPKL